MTLALTTPLRLVDWPSIGWVALIGALTFAVMVVKARYPKFQHLGPAVRTLAHVSIGYFSVAMMGFGAWSAFHSYFPVPGGTGWDGTLGLVGGLAALTVGGCTLAEHALQVAALRRAGSDAQAQPAVIPVDA